MNTIPQESPELTLSDLVEWKVWREEHAAMFPTDDSFQWFFRKNRKEFDEAGAVVAIRGAIYLVKPVFEATFIAVARDARSKGHTKNQAS